LLAKPTPRNVTLGSVRFAMFNNQRDIFFRGHAGFYHAKRIEMVGLAPRGRQGQGERNARPCRRCAARPPSPRVRALTAFPA
jgi:hypothetical protein